MYDHALRRVCARCAVFARASPAPPAPEPRTLNPPQGYTALLEWLGREQQPAPAPRFSRTSSELTLAPAHAGQHSREVLERSGFDARSIAELLESGAVKQA